ncbi:hypothetical protein Dimus_007132 [Dionaea muscipula]
MVRRAFRGENVVVSGAARYAIMERYVLRLFISVKYITANVIDRSNGRIVATASTIEHSVKSAFDCGRTSNVKAAAAVGEVLAMRLRVQRLDHQDLAERGILAHVNKEIEKKSSQDSAKIRAIVDALRCNGVKLILLDDD